MSTSRPFPRSCASTRRARRCPRSRTPHLPASPMPSERNPRSAMTDDIRRPRLDAARRPRRRQRRALPGAPHLLRGAQLRRARKGDGRRRGEGAAVLLHQAGRRRGAGRAARDAGTCATRSARRTCTTRSSWWWRSAVRGARLDAEPCARRRVRLRGRARHDAPRPAERHAREEATVGHRQVVRAGRADRADPPGRARRPPRARRDPAGRERRGAPAGRPRGHDLGRAAHARVPVALLRAPAGRPRVHRHAVRRGRGGRRRSARRRTSTACRRCRSSIDRARTDDHAGLHPRVRRARLQQSRGGARPSARGSRARRRCPPRRATRCVPPLDLRYGEGPKETLDLFVPARARAGHAGVHPRRLLARARQGRLPVRRDAVRRGRPSRSP